MKIIISNGSFEVGGIESFIEILANGITRRGHDVTILFTTNILKSLYTRISDKVNIIKLRGDLFSPNACIRKAIKIISALDADILLLNSDLIIQSSLPYLPNRLIRMPVIHTITEDAFHNTLAHKDYWDKAIAVSPRIKTIAMNKVTGKEIAFIPHGINLSLFNPINSDKLNTSNIILYAGRLLNEAKGIFDLPQILLHLVKDGLAVKMVLLGDGPDRTRCQDLFSSLGLREYVEFRGDVSKTEVSEWMRKSACLILPSRYEGLGFVLLEAMACGCPPVVSLIPMVTDYVVDNNKAGILVALGDIEGFAGAIKRLITEPELREKMAVAGVNRVSRHFSADTMVDAYLNIFERTINERAYLSIPDPKKIKYLPLGSELIPFPWVPRLLRGLWRKIPLNKMLRNLCHR